MEANISKSTDTFEFESSNGTLITDHKGYVLPSSDLSDWLLDIKRVDIEELGKYYALSNREIDNKGDILDVGFWDKDDNYNKPERSWRYDIFHEVDADDSEIESRIKTMEKWVEENR